MINNSDNNEEEISIQRLYPNNISENDEFINYKIIIVGNSGVGKSSLLKRAVQKQFTDNYQATIGFEFLLIYYDINGTKIKLQIWDTCGQEMYRSLVQGFYRNTALTLLVYAINDQKSYDDINEWIKDIRNNTEKKVPIFLVGNKNDLNDKIINIVSGEELAKQNELSYFCEASAKTGFNVENIFIEITKFLYKEYLKGKTPYKKIKMEMDKKVEEEELFGKKKCCS